MQTEEERGVEVAGVEEGRGVEVARQAEGGGELYPRSEAAARLVFDTTEIRLQPFKAVRSIIVTCQLCNNHGSRLRWLEYTL